MDLIRTTSVLWIWGNWVWEYWRTYGTETPSAENLIASVFETKREIPQRRVITSLRQQVSILLLLRFVPFLFLWSPQEISSGASVSPTTSLRIGRGPTYGDAHSLRWPSPVFPSPPPPPPSHMGASPSVQLLGGIQAEHSENGGKQVEQGFGKSTHENCSFSQLSSIVNIEACFPSLEWKLFFLNAWVISAPSPWTTESLLHQIQIEAHCCCLWVSKSKFWPWNVLSWNGSDQTSKDRSFC